MAEKIREAWAVMIGNGKNGTAPFIGYAACGGLAVFTKKSDALVYARDNRAHGLPAKPVKVQITTAP